MAHGDFHPYTHRSEFVTHARLLWRTARQAQRGGYTPLATDFERRALALLQRARLLPAGGVK